MREEIEPADIPGAEDGTPRPTSVSTPRILAADDDPVVLRALQRILDRGGFDVRATMDGGEVPAMFADGGADMVILDLHLGDVEATDVIRRLRPLVPAGSYLPILVVSGDLSDEARMAALAEGATDFISKPYRVDEVLLRVRNHLHTRALHIARERQNRELEQKVRERTRELEEAAWEVLDRLGRAAELRDDDTGLHARRVAALSARIAAALGLGQDEVELIRRTAPLHDIGKVGIPDHVLRKQGALTPAEWEVMKQHTTIGAQILSRGRSAMVRLAESIALSHHERWDGTGYPQGLAGERIPLAARIVALADVYDALSSDRPYRPALPHPEVIAHITRDRATHFDPRVADVFLAHVAGRDR